MLNNTLDFPQFAVISWKLKKMENRLQHKKLVSSINKGKRWECFETSPWHSTMLSLMILILIPCLLQFQTNNSSLFLCTHILNHDAFLMFVPLIFFFASRYLFVSSIMPCKNFAPMKCKKYSWGAELLSIQFIGPGLYCGVNFKQSSGPRMSFSWTATCVQSLSAVLQT